jgi:hypothetical protein
MKKYFRKKEEFLKKVYKKIKKTGMFWELHPELTGIWKEDKQNFIKKHSNYDLKNNINNEK